VSTRSKIDIKAKVDAYQGFSGLDSSRDAKALDTGSGQALLVCDNAHCDWRGQIVRDASGRYLAGQLPIKHLIHYGRSLLAWAEEDGAGVHLRSVANHVFPNAYPVGTRVTSALFNRRLYFTARGGLLYSYDGVLWQEASSNAMKLMRPGYICTVQRRLVAAGIPGLETEVHLSRVDDASKFPDDEDPAEENVLRGGAIDIANLISGAGQITGISGFEQNKLVIFTDDQAVIYSIDPDIEQWSLDSSANIQMGCISHASIQRAGTDLLYCSRAGVHSLRREANGLMMGTYTMSDRVDLLYRELVRSVPDPQDISAVFDKDRSQYHIFFPQAGGEVCKRLTMSLSPPAENGEKPSQFSTGSFLNARCGSFLSGQLVYGTPGGAYDMLAIDDEGTATVPEATVMTPFLWHGSFSDDKMTQTLTIQASGAGVIEVECHDLYGNLLGEMRVEIDEDSDDTSYASVPLSRQYERPWAVRYLAARYTLRVVESRGLVRIVGLAIKIRND